MAEKKSNKKIWIAVCAAAVVVIAMLAIWLTHRPTTQEGEKAVTLEVVDDEGETTSYSENTDAEYLSEVMDELAETQDFSYEGTDSDYGLYITTVNGITADYNTNGAYWSIIVNGEYGQYGADQQPVADGDDFQLVYTEG